MSSKLFVRFLLASVFGALVLGIVTLFGLQALTENSSVEFRRAMALTLARTFERGPIPGTNSAIEEHPEFRRPRQKTWVVSETGEVLESSNQDSLPAPWSSLPKPESVHEVSGSFHFLDMGPTITVVRLVSEKPTYLVIESGTSDCARKRNLLQIVLFGAALAFSALFSTLMTSIYLRRKSRQAREVLLRLERGDLKARFQIKQFDEMGNLMLDFNRMASEIERLVGRLEETETARKTMFQELSHDLRTPLTSLKTSIDTLALHWKEMPETHRSEVIAVCQAEISYFMQLLESLLFLAQMDEPRYKKSTEEVNVGNILDAETRIRQTHALGVTNQVKWKLELPHGASVTTLPGDSHLIRRLIRNVMDNAGRFAKSEVGATVFIRAKEVVIQVSDDGPGMSNEQIEEFGMLRNRRLLDVNDLSHVSLGLGSVIIKKIVELHHGSLTIQSSPTGTSVEIRIPQD